MATYRFAYSKAGQPRAVARRNGGEDGPREAPSLPYSISPRPAHWGETMDLRVKGGRGRGDFGGSPGRVLLLGGPDPSRPVTRVELPSESWRPQSVRVALPPSPPAGYTHYWLQVPGPSAFPRWLRILHAEPLVCPTFTVDPPRATWGGRVKLVASLGLTFGREPGRVLLRGGLPAAAPGEELVVESWTEPEIIVRLPEAEPDVPTPHLIVVQMQVLGATHECAQPIVIEAPTPVKVLRLVELRCIEPETYIGPDNARLDVTVDPGAPDPTTTVDPRLVDVEGLRALPFGEERSMDNGDEWTLNWSFLLVQRLRVKLWDVDRAWRWAGDDNDLLGELVLEPEEVSAAHRGTGTFAYDGACYELDYEVQVVPPALPRRVLRPAAPSKNERRATARQAEKIA